MELTRLSLGPPIELASQGLQFVFEPTSSFIEQEKTRWERKVGYTCNHSPQKTAGGWDLKSEANLAYIVRHRLKELKSNKTGEIPSLRSLRR